MTSPKVVPNCPTLPAYRGTPDSGRNQMPAQTSLGRYLSA